MKPEIPLGTLGNRGTWRSYTLADGLVGLQVEDIAEDATGDLWFGTWDSGVSRYDGYEFRNFTRGDGLCGNAVMAVYPDEQGRLWFGTRDGGACWYDGEAFHRFAPGDGVSDGSITFIAPDSEGRLWFGGIDTLGYFDGERFHDLVPACREAVGATENVLNECHGIVQDRDGDVWFGFNRLLRFDGTRFHASRPDTSPRHSQHKSFTYAIAGDDDGLLWMGGYDALGRFDGERFERLSGANGSLVRKIHRDDRDRVWFSTSGGGVLCHQDGRVVHFTARDGLAHDKVNDIHCDREGLIWFATWGGGVSSYDPDSVRYFSSGDDLSHDSPFALLEDGRGGVWTGFVQSYSSTHKSAARYAGDGYAVWGEDQGLGIGQCWALCAGADGDIWLGGEHGLARYDGQCFHNAEIPGAPAAPTVYSLAAADGGLVIGYRDEKTKTVRICRCPDGAVLFSDEKLARNQNECIVDIVPAEGGDIWFAYSARESTSRGRGLGLWRAGEEPRFFTTADGLVDNRVEALHEDRRQRLWIATLGGVSCYADGRFRNYTAADGLPNNRIHCICEDRRGHLWFGTDSGVLRYDGRVFQSINLPELNYVTAIVEDREGYFWFAALHHVVRYTANRTPPRVRLRQVVADQVYDSNDPIEIPAPTRQVVFEYQGMSFRTPPDDMLYVSRLRGHDTDWRPAARATRAFYRDLPTGRYTFEVRAIDRDLNMSTAAAVRLDVVPDPRLEALSEALSDTQEVFVGNSPSLGRVQSQIAEAAPTDLTLLILGETGTGKGLVARTIHHLSERKGGPFVQVNCGALPGGLVESELFGHERGAFTDARSRKLGKAELAGGGTLFLDEIGDLAPEAQVKLLRLLEEQTFERVGGTQTLKADARILAATNRDLQQMVEDGAFRMDLYYRLQGFPLLLPPLRRRRDDIGLLASHFRERMANHLGKTVAGMSPEALAALEAYHWPGNVRELEHAIERAVIVCRDTAIQVEDLAIEARPPAHETGWVPLQENERRYISAVLEHADWVIKGPRGAAALLGMHPSTLHSRMKKLGISRPA